MRKVFYLILVCQSFSLVLAGSADAQELNFDQISIGDSVKIEHSDIWPHDSLNNDHCNVEEGTIGKVLEKTINSRFPKGDIIGRFLRISDAFSQRRVVVKFLNSKDCVFLFHDYKLDLLFHSKNERIGVVTDTKPNGPGGIGFTGGFYLTRTDNTQSNKLGHNQNQILKAFLKHYKFFQSYDNIYNSINNKGVFQLGDIQMGVNPVLKPNGILFEKLTMFLLFVSQILKV